MSQSPARRPDAPGSIVTTDPAQASAIRLNCQILEALSADMARHGDNPDREHMLKLGAEIRKLAAAIRTP